MRRRLPSPGQSQAKHQQSGEAEEVQGRQLQHQQKRLRSHLQLMAGPQVCVCVLCSSDAQPVLSLGPQSSVLHPPQYTRLATMPAGAAKEPGTSQTAKDTMANGGAAGHEQERGGGAQVGAVQAAAEEQPSAVSAEDAKALSAAYASLGDAALPYVPFTPLFSMLL